MILLRIRSFRAAVALVLTASISVVVRPETTRGQDAPTAEENLAPHGLDSEHLFGFAEGSDLGVPGEAELEWETTGRLGRRLGRFRAIDSGLALKVPLTADFRLAPGVTFNAYDIAIPGSPGGPRGGINGGFLEGRYRLLDRRDAPVGLTVNLVPGYAGADGGSGLAAHSFATEAGLLVDRELVPGTLIAALNASVAFAATTLRGTDGTQRASGLELSAALAQRLGPGLFAGAEARYARAYDGLALARFTGHAVYLGPTLYATLTPQAWISVAWSFQVAGQAEGEPGGLDLTSFDRHQARLRIGYSF